MMLSPVRVAVSLKANLDETSCSHIVSLRRHVKIASSEI